MTYLVLILRVGSCYEASLLAKPALGDQAKGAFGLRHHDINQITGQIQVRTNSKQHGHLHRTLSVSVAGMIRHL